MPDGSFRTSTAFTVLVGTLSESAQARARAVRARMIREGSGPKVVALDFTVERVTFTVDDLTHPNERQNATRQPRSAGGGQGVDTTQGRAYGSGGEAANIEQGTHVITAGMFPVTCPPGN